MLGRTPGRWLLAATIAACAAAPVRSDDSPEKQFAERIKPLLTSRCLACHGPDEQEGGLRLDSRGAALKGGERGPAIVPQKPAESLLIRAVKHEKHDYAMPPKEKLAAADIAALERWIRDGAHWPDKSIEPAPLPATPSERIGDAWTDPRNPIVKIFGGERLDLWSLKPIVRPTLPSILNLKSKVQNPIDALSGSETSDPVAPRTLIRRLHFDAIGLPPAPEEVEEFLADQRPDAYQQLVDRLLTSPRFGEHQARAWLDVVRYSDSNGFDWDEFRPQAWRYRDWVISALNADQSYDQFIREQLAGDELLNGPPRSPAEQAALVATGFLRIGPQDNSSALFNEQARSRAEWMNDLVETTGTAFLGLTFNCCRCHDHKHDPVSHADYYRFRAFFEPLKYADDLPLDLADEQEQIRVHNAAIDKQLEPLQQRRDEPLAAAKLRIRERRTKELTDDERTLLALKRDEQPADVKAKIDALSKRIDPSDEEIQKELTDDEKKSRDSAAEEIKSLEGRRRKFTHGLVATDKQDDVPATHVLYQGDYRAERDAVVPGFLSVLDPNSATLASPANAHSTGRRLTLANWIVSRENPLTARVAVNRLWQGYFGEGLVATSGDFGLAGARPSNPAQLDWLASELIESDWSLKAVHRRILTSGAYTQPRTARRVTAEQLRDSLLAVSGLLTNKSGGPPVWPELPTDVLTANPAFLDDNETKTKGWYPSPRHEQYARSVFQVQKRTVKVPFMETFDLPENMVSCARRGVSTVPPQALSLLNSSLAIDAAKALAERLKADAGEEAAAQIALAFRLALAREPSEEESADCAELIQSAGLVQLCRVMLNLNELVYVD
jgi:mono/diheme cytochrome c family protein